VDFLREAQNYHLVPQGSFSDIDDCIDSARYALLGCLNDLAQPWDNRTPRERMMAQRDRYVPKRQPTSSWKQTFDAGG